jgi:hypothetical protein
MAGPVNPTQGVSYNAPTQNTDGTPLTLADIAGFEVGIGEAPGQYSKIVQDTTLEAVGRQVTTMAQIGALSFGQKYSAARAISKLGKVSAWSNEVQFVVEPPTPSAPTNFSVA